MAVSALRRLAAGAPVAVFAAVGEDAIERVENLMLNPDVDWVASPRHANVLLVAGPVRSTDRQALRVVHDQLPGLRATLWWGAEPFDELTSSPRFALADDVLPHLRELQRQFHIGDRASEPDLLPDQPPAPWRGVGDHGQGGKGMMGGTPYGRPMTMPGNDLRDGLMLDESTVEIGPYLQTWPAGLVLELVLQGDVVQRSRVVRPPLPPTRHAHADLHGYLRCAARALSLLQLDAHAERCRRAAQALDRHESVDVAAVHAAIRRSGAFAAIPQGLGTCLVDGVESDVRTRLDRWLRSDDSTSQFVPSGATAKAPAMRPAALVELLTGLEWNEAMLVVNSFTPAQLQGLAPCDEPADGEDKSAAKELSH